MKIVCYTGSNRGIGGRNDHHSIRTGIQHVLLRWFRAGRTRTLYAQRGLLFSVRIRICGTGAQTGTQVAQDGTSRGPNSVRGTHNHQEQRLAGRRVSVPVGRAHKSAKRYMNLIVFIAIDLKNYFHIGF